MNLLSTHKRWLGWALPALALASVAAVILWGSAHNLRKLPGGGTVALAKITFGKHQRLRLDDRWQDYLGMLLPNALATRLGSRILDQTLSQDRCVFWTTWTGTMRHGGNLGCLRDEHGCLLGWVVSFTTSAYPANSSWIEGFSFDPPPPGVRAIELQVFGAPEPRAASGPPKRPELARFVVSNPAYPKRNSLAPHPTPSTRRIGSYGFSLLEFVTGVDTKDSLLHAPENPQQEGSKVRVGVTQDGKPTGAWQPLGSLEILDENRKVLGGSTRAWTTHGDASEFQLQGPPLCSEAVYLARVGFEQTSDFTESQCGTFRVPVPTENQVLLTNLEAAVPGSRLVFRGVAGQAQVLPGAVNAEGHNLLSGAEYTHTCWVELAPPPPSNPPPAPSPSITYAASKARLLEARDEQGRLAFVRRAVNQQSNFVFALVVPAGARQLVLKFAESRPVTLDFAFKPNRFRPPPR